MLISSTEALKEVLNHQIATDTVKVSLLQSIGKVLRENITADRDFPPFDRVMMDGIAFSYKGFEEGVKTYRRAGVQAAGAPPLKVSMDYTYIEVMTGAVLPKGTDTVIPYEQLINQVDGYMSIGDDLQVKKGQHVHPQGFDRKAGSVLMEEGTVISSAELGVMASVGKSEVLVSKAISVAIISTGKELVEVHENPLPHQIRKSNVYSIYGALQAYTDDIKLYHMSDSYKEITSKLEDILEKHQLIILSGGVSKGLYDFIPQALEEKGVVKSFHRVAQRPGKPFWFGAKDETAVFALPGNPVSTFMCLYKYVVPWMKHSMGIKNINQEEAVLGEDISFKPSMTYFLQVRLSISQDGKWVAMPMKGKGSGDLANLLEADALMELPSDRIDFKKGEVFPVLRYR